MGSKNPFTLITDKPANTELVGFLENLLEEARLGELQGMSWVEAWSGGRFSYGSTHSRHISRIGLCGMVQLLNQEHLAELADIYADEEEG